jgi:hypothetical protein
VNTSLLFAFIISYVKRKQALISVLLLLLHLLLLLELVRGNTAVTQRMPLWRPSSGGCVT